LKKSAQKLSGIRAGGVCGDTPWTQIKESFLLLFYKKAELPSLKSHIFLQRRRYDQRGACRGGAGRVF
jgi:hypothetical protein